MTCVACFEPYIITTHEKSEYDKFCTECEAAEKRAATYEEAELKPAPTISTAELIQQEFLT
jgi:uncharacterized metal-binding protein YceD (DUF177 family)